MGLTVCAEMEAKKNKQTYNAQDLAELLEISTSKAYQFIKKMNDELAAAGYLTCRGRVPRAYFEKRFYGAGANE